MKDTMLGARVMGVDNLHEIYNDLNEIKELITKKISHPYLLRFIENPYIDEDKLLLLYLIMLEADMTKEVANDYILPTMLVQIALDTHESVTASSDNSNDSIIKNRQLTVLAGDYYSGLYYHLLAGCGDVRMISALADAIKKINEQKMFAYYNKSVTVEQLFEKLGFIESALVQKVADFFRLPQYKTAAASFFLLKRLLVERKGLVRGNCSRWIEKNIEMPNGTSDMLEQIDSAIERILLSEGTGLTAGSFAEQVVRTRMNGLINEFGFYKEKVVEEG